MERARAYFKAKPDIFTTRMDDQKLQQLRASVIAGRHGLDMFEFGYDQGAVPTAAFKPVSKCRQKMSLQLFAHDILLFMQDLRRWMPSWENNYLTDAARRALGEYGTIWTRENPSFTTNTLRRVLGSLHCSLRLGHARDPEVWSMEGHDQPLYRASQRHAARVGGERGRVRSLEAQVGVQEAARGKGCCGGDSPLLGRAQAQGRFFTAPECAEGARVQARRGCASTSAPRLSCRPCFRLATCPRSVSTFSSTPWFTTSRHSSASSSAPTLSLRRAGRSCWTRTRRVVAVARLT
ncbi:hypothetical protein BCR44DRAFT_1135860 [Catenaria anguillulae PL171]|uniref:Uncharacterized protein n=1 Tax=Catenaria anguillulae PL171 TaxID=765915 RepID=A0A1Y2H400_9FUNG|nr:hypothetical protein BCR44DRAFT_1135860 [Catenaria anguillulae PL171]